MANQYDLSCVETLKSQKITNKCVQYAGRLN